MSTGGQPGTNYALSGNTQAIRAKVILRNIQDNTRYKLRCYLAFWDEKAQDYKVVDEAVIDFVVDVSGGWNTITTINGYPGVELKADILPANRGYNTDHRPVVSITNEGDTAADVDVIISYDVRANSEVF